MNRKSLPPRSPVPYHRAHRRLATMLVWLVCCTPFAFVCAGQDEDPVTDARQALEQWVQTQQLISKEKKDLALAKEMLNARIELIENEISSLQEKIQKAEDSIAEADKKRQDMMQENEKLKDASVSLATTAEQLENRTQELLKRLPDPICDRVKPLSQRLPEDPQQTKLSISERFQNVVGILNEVDKFNRDISVFSEVRTFPDGTSVEVATMYVGLGHAFYASANGNVAGTGASSEQGWIWKENNLAASDILDAIGILKNEKVASFVRMPVEIQ